MAEIEDTVYPSAAMRTASRRIRMAAQSDSTILLLGETGSGKDFLALYIHQHSRRSREPFFAINCATIPSDLAESELFGHEPGAFTSAQASKPGLVEMAQSGTLLLNEIGELALPLQGKLLTFLDTRKFMRVGGQMEIAVNARIIAATNKDLWKEVEAGRFRRDLYFRIGELVICVPPLRERMEDLPVLVAKIVNELAPAMGLSPVPAISASAMGALREYTWPGNVRELCSVLKNALGLSQGGIVDREDIWLPEPQAERLSLEEGLPSIISELLRKAASKRVRNPSATQKERLYRECMLERDWKQKDIAQRLDVSESTVCLWMGDVRANHEKPRTR